MPILEMRKQAQVNAMFVVTKLVSGGLDFHIRSYDFKCHDDAN